MQYLTSLLQSTAPVLLPVLASALSALLLAALRYVIVKTGVTLSAEQRAAVESAIGTGVRSAEEWARLRLANGLGPASGAEKQAQALSVAARLAPKALAKLPVGTDVSILKAKVTDLRATTPTLFPRG